MAAWRRTGVTGLKDFKRFNSDAPKLPDCDFVLKKYTGPSLQKLQEIRKANLNPALKTIYSKPLALHQGYKQWLFDIEGKRYLDLFGGICTVSVGHCHPKINDAIKQQIETLGHVSNIYYHDKIHEYAAKLANKMPENLKVVYFTNSGSEANDLAILMSRLYTKNFDILSFRNCYHGMTCQTMALTAAGTYKYKTPQAPGFTHVMNPDVYRGIWGGCRDSPIQTINSCNCASEECESSDKYLQEFNEVFKYTVPKGGIAAFFAESIQGVGGAVQYPKGYLKKVFGVVKENGGLFISDEVQSGFGRTGDHFWGFEGHGIVPDVVTMAKGIGNGFPLAAVVTTPEIAAALSSASHFNTFGGNPVASAVGIAVLDVIEEEGLQENSRNVGTYFLRELEKLRADFEIVGDVRGKGLMIGVELVETKNCLTLLAGERFVKLWDYCKELGLVFGRGGLSGNVLRIKPPMCITKHDVDFSIVVLKEGLKYVSV